MAMIPNLQYQTPQEALTLQKAAKAQQGHRIKQGQLQEAMVQNDQSKQILDQYLSTGEVPVVQDLHPDLQPQVDALNDKIANQQTDVADGELHPLYFDLKDKLDNVQLVDDHELLAAASVLPQEKVIELRKSAELNKQLRPKQDEVKSVIRDIDAAFDKVIEVAGTFDNADVASVALREIEEERGLVIEEIKQLFADGGNKNEISLAVQKTFEGKRKGILENRFMTKFKTGVHEFTKRLEKGATEQERRRAIINLMMAGDYEREIEATIEAGWFDE
jgi:hypothetical protein